MLDWIRNGKARDKLTSRMRARMRKLADRERDLESLASEMRNMLEAFESELRERETRWQWELEETKEQLRSYSRELDRTRDELSVAEGTIEAQQASHQALVQRMRTQESLDIARMVAAKPGSNGGGEI